MPFEFMPFELTHVQFKTLALLSQYASDDVDGIRNPRRALTEWRISLVFVTTSASESVSSLFVTTLSPAADGRVPCTRCLTSSC